MGNNFTEQDYIDEENRYRKEQKRKKAIDTLAAMFADNIEEYGIEYTLAELIVNLYDDLNYYSWAIE